MDLTLLGKSQSVKLLNCILHLQSSSFGSLQWGDLKVS